MKHLLLFVITLVISFSSAVVFSDEELSDEKAQQIKEHMEGGETWHGSTKGDGRPPEPAPPQPGQPAAEPKPQTNKEINAAIKECFANGGTWNGTTLTCS